MYPTGIMVSVTNIDSSWRRLSTERVLAQGRCLSPVLSLLQVVERHWGKDAFCPVSRPPIPLKRKPAQKIIARY
jgi:hypothetical protein